LKSNDASSGKHHAGNKITTLMNMVASKDLTFAGADIAFSAMRKAYDIKAPDFLNNVWLSNRKLLKHGNTKLDKSIAIWSVPAVFTCKNSKDCQSQCYALRFQRMYPSVRKGRMARYLLSKYFRPYFRDQIVKEIKDHGSKVVRIHESGDFYRKSYVNDWRTIATRCKDVQFYFYTKVSKLTDGLASETNVNRVNSILPNGRVNFGPKDEMVSIAKETGYPLCPATVQKADNICGNTCKICQHEPNVLFVKH
jgi:hypothetical protein